MTFLLFLISYSVAFMAHFISEKWVIVHITALLSYLIVVYKVRPAFIDRAAIHPIMLALVTSFGIQFIEGGTLSFYFYYLFIWPFLKLISKGNIELFPNELNKVILFIQKFIITSIAPIAMAFILLLINVSNEIKSILFVIGYLFVVYFISLYVTSLKSFITIGTLQTLAFIYIVLNFMHLPTHALITLIICTILVGVVGLKWRDLRFSILSKTI